MFFIASQAEQYLLPQSQIISFYYKWIETNQYISPLLAIMTINCLFLYNKYMDKET